MAEEIEIPWLDDSESIDIVGAIIKEWFGHTLVINEAERIEDCAGNITEALKAKLQEVLSGDDELPPFVARYIQRQEQAAHEGTSQ
jgi:hypothetical protein